MEKKHMNWMMLCKLPLGASLWAILFFFIFTACQDDAPYEDTEVMVTFTTRAETTQGDKASSAIVQERMNNLRVIMVRANGDVVDNHVAENITQTTVTFVFKTPIKTGGERFTFYAIANEVGLTPANEGELDWIEGKENMNGKMDLYKQLVVGTGSAFNAKGTVTPEKYIPQTKYWAVDVPQVLSQTLEPQRLDYAVSKIMLTFDNKKNTDQSLSNIYISGILPNGKGYLFKQNEPSSDYVTYDVGAEKIINFEDVTVSQSSSKTLHYYTYPVDAANISNPTLHATWNGTEYSLELPGVSSLLRGQRLDIVVTLDQGLAVNFSIKDWEVNNTNIGSSPNVGGNYGAGDWTDQDIDINGGDDPVEPNPGGGNGGGDAPIDGSVLWSGEETLNWSNHPIYCKAFNDLDYDVTTDYKIRIYYNTIDNGQTPQLQFLNASEQGMGIPELNNSNSTDITIGSTSFEFSINEAMLNNFLNNEDATVAFYVRGYQLIITKVLLFLPSTE